jgi:CBS domain-containing protein
VFSAAGQEAAVGQSKALVERLPARAAMVTDVRTLSPGATLGEASGALLTTSQTDFPVLLGDQVVGVLTRRALVEALGRHGPNGYVSGAMAREFVRVRPDDDLERCFLPRTACSPARRTCSSSRTRRAA